MTAFIISGFFSLTSGRRIRTDVPRPNGTTQGVYYVHYDTVVQCSQTGPISAEVRKYSPPGEAVLQDDTIAYVTAKAYMPPPNMPRTLLLEAIHIAPEPGDPTSDSYEESVPDLPFPSVLIHGTVSSEHKVNDGGVVIFPVTVSDYVRGNNKISTISWRMDKGTPRWKNVPAPNKTTQVTLFGTCFQMQVDGILCVDLESISLPIAAANPSSTITTPDVAPGKRRKFPSRAPQSSTSAESGNGVKSSSEVEHPEPKTSEGIDRLLAQHAIRDDVPQDQGTFQGDDQGPSTRGKGKRKNPN